MTNPSIVNIFPRLLLFYQLDPKDHLTLFFHLTQLTNAHVGSAWSLPCCQPQRGPPCYGSPSVLLILCYCLLELWRLDWKPHVEFQSPMSPLSFHSFGTFLLQVILFLSEVYQTGAGDAASLASVFHPAFSQTFGAKLRLWMCTFFSSYCFIVGGPWSVSANRPLQWHTRSESKRGLPCKVYSFLTVAEPRCFSPPFPMARVLISLRD